MDFKDQILQLSDRIKKQVVKTEKRKKEKHGREIVRVFF